MLGCQTGGLPASKVFSRAKTQVLLAIVKSLETTHLEKGGEIIFQLHPILGAQAEIYAYPGFLSTTAASQLRKSKGCPFQSDGETVFQAMYYGQY